MRRFNPKKHRVLAVLGYGIISFVASPMIIPMLFQKKGRNFLKTRIYNWKG
jgi:hypothetical protein